MTEKVYCDTCVFRDFLEGRNDPMRPLADFAQNFFSAVMDGQYILVYSDHVIYEFEKYLPQGKIQKFISDLGENIEFIQSTKDDRTESRIYSNPPDALHALLAIKANAKMLTTRNIVDFEDFCEIIEIVLPESL